MQVPDESIEFLLKANQQVRFPQLCLPQNSTPFEISHDFFESQQRPGDSMRQTQQVEQHEGQHACHADHDGDRLLPERGMLLRGLIFQNSHRILKPADNSQQNQQHDVVTKDVEDGSTDDRSLHTPVDHLLRSWLLHVPAPVCHGVRLCHGVRPRDRRE